MHRKQLLTLLTSSALLAQPTWALAQANARSAPGYIVTSQGDTLRGRLTVPRFVTDEGVTFAAGEQAPARKYAVPELRAFGLQDGRRFVKRTMAVRRNAETGTVDSATVILQHLVGGYANFYRYDMNAVRHAAAGDYARPEVVQYYLDAGGSSLAQVQRPTYQVTLAAVLADCPALAAAVPRTLFDEDEVGDLLQRYNAECHAAVPAHNYRLPKPPSTVRVLVSARAGIQSGKLFYAYLDYLQQADAQAATVPTYGLELRLAYQGPWSLIVGVNYARLRSTSTRVQPAQLGTTNTGQLLSRPSRVEVQSLQAPVLVRYTLGHGLLRPYVAAGLLFGMYVTNETALSYTALTYVGGNTIYYRDDVVTAPVQNPRLASPTVGSCIRLGVHLKTKARVSPLLEAQYCAGSDNEPNSGVQQSPGLGIENLGNLRYQSIGLLAGLEF